MMNSKEFCNLLREIAIALAEGKQEVVEMPRAYIDANLDPTDAAKITPSYARTIMNRLAEVKEVGSISVKYNQDVEGVMKFIFTLNKSQKRKVIYTKDDIPRIQAKAIKQVLQVSPDMGHLEPEGVVVAVDIIKRYKDLIRNMFGMEDE